MSSLKETLDEALDAAQQYEVSVAPDLLEMAKAMAMRTPKIGAEIYLLEAVLIGLKERGKSRQKALEWIIGASATYPYDTERPTEVVGDRGGVTQKCSN